MHTISDNQTIVNHGPKKKSRGKFIVFEGLDGCGKSTQMRMLATRLKKYLYVHTTAEPTAGLKKKLKYRIPENPFTLAMAYAQDRFQHVTHKRRGLRYLINNGVTVLCDRYYFSSYAYQGLHVDMDYVISINGINAETLRPDINIFIDVPAQVCFERIKKRAAWLGDHDNPYILANVRDKYMTAFAKLKYAERVLVVDGQKDKQKVHDDIIQALFSLDQDFFDFFMQQNQPLRK